ncbi:MAG: pyruvate kinase [Desulfobacterales bacterium]
MQNTKSVFKRLVPPLISLREDAIRLEEELSDELAQVETAYRNSARNFIHYLSVRQKDIRNLQHDLASLGLSSLGVLEANVMASLNAVLGVLEKLTGQDLGPMHDQPADFRTGPLLLQDHTRSLLGPQPYNRSVRIMVTMPHKAADDPQLVRDMLAAGMDVMRINCAHGNPEIWTAIVNNLRKAEQALGRKCMVQADLAGPKLRTGPIKPAGRLVKLEPERDFLGNVVTPGKVWLASEDSSQPGPPSPDAILWLDPKLIDLAEEGDIIQFRNLQGEKKKIRLVSKHGDSFCAETTQTIYVFQDARFELIRRNECIAEGQFGRLPEIVPPIVLYPQDTLILTRSDDPGSDTVRDENGKVVEPARIHCTLDSAFEAVRPNDKVWFDDGKIGGVVKANDGQQIKIEITQASLIGTALQSEKGINFPDTVFNMPALTEKDINDLSRVVKFVDMVALSFLRDHGDVLHLEEHLHRLRAGHIGIVLKIENRQAFENLPRILLTALQSPPVGVMVARGDLAVEVGFERLSEVQEEILWLCEAAHVPVIWATQMLEGLAKNRALTRAEVTDAAMSHRAECAMLNKGPHIVEAVNFLNGVLKRMESHGHKRKAMLRKLTVAKIDWTAK